MRYFIALVCAALLIGGLFLVASLVTAQMVAWEHGEVTLSSSQRALAVSAQYVHRYWYLLALVIVGLCLGAAALVPMSRSTSAPAE